MSIVFMGTSDFSLKALIALLDSGFDVAAVYTRPPKPAGRNYKMQKSIVHEFAERRNICVHTPRTLRTKEQDRLLRSLRPDVAIVSSYGLIIPQNILDIPTYGFINIHASLLPRWRGASPIQAAILAGDTQSGVTIMKMDAGVDTGDIIAMQPIDISTKTTYGDLVGKMWNLGAAMILDVLNNLPQCLASAHSQSNDGATYAEKISKNSCKIDWNDTVKNVLRKIMAFSPSPAAWSEINGMRIKIMDADECSATTDSSSGNDCSHHAWRPGVLHSNMTVSCRDGYLQLVVVQPAGKNKMSAADFARGYGNLVGKTFG